MNESIPKLKQLGWRRVSFSIVVLAYVGFLGFINALMFLPALGWLPDNALSAMGHFGSFLDTRKTHDFIHEFVFAFIVGTAAVGLLSQLWKPKENFAGQLVALTAWVIMIVIAAFTNSWVPQPLFIIFGGLTLLATILHPAGHSLFNWLSTKRVNRVLLALVIIAAVPLLSLAVTNITLQRAGTNMQPDESGEFLNLFGHKIPKHGGSEDRTSLAEKHSDLGHYRNLAALNFIVILVGLLASFQPSGWRFAAWIVGILPILLGLASVILPGAESSLGLTWGLASIVWGIVFIATAEFIHRRDIPDLENT